MIKGRRGPSGFGYASTAEEVTEGLDLSGRRILVTGINSGLGRETGRVLALRGATILGAARTLDKAEAALAGFDGDGHVPLVCELSEPESVAACAAAIDAEVDVLLCNAGIMALPELELRHGYERQLFTNHIGHFILVTRLLDRLAEGGRVVMLSSSAHSMAPEGGIQFDNLRGEQRYDGWKNYGQSKLANLLFAKALARRLDGGRTANAVHPGVIHTNLGRHMGLMHKVAPLVSWTFMKSVAQGAATQCYVAVHPAVAGVSGEYFADCNVAKSSRYSRDPELAQRLWEVSERIVAEVGV